MSDVQTTEAPIDLSSSEYYFNRELSHLQFNIRVLEQALDESHPLLDRLFFLCIFSRNLDEFYEVRVANLTQQLTFAREQAGADGMHPQQVLSAIHTLCSETVERQYRILNETILPALEQENVHFQRRRDWTEEQRLWVEEYFRDSIQPLVSPIGLDPSHPFPRLVNKSLNFIVELDGKDAFGRETGLAIIPAPRSLPRIIRIPDHLTSGGDHFIFLSSMIHEHAAELFPGMKVKGCYQFRVTRNADLEIDEDGTNDLASALEDELHSRNFGEEMRLEVADNCPSELVNFLLHKFNLAANDLYMVNGPVNLGRMMEVIGQINRPDLQYTPFTPGLPKNIKFKKSIFESMRERDTLLLHPFESFTPVVDLLREAAKDPAVRAIKQTLYRTGAKSEIVNALVDAARSGKEVTVVIELRARFDEEENLYLANRLQEAGAVVVYGVVGYKTHAKMMLIVRKEEDRYKRYVHLGTGNYHAGNARAYTDYSFLTSNDVIGEDVAAVFQQLTGMGAALKIKKLFHAPFTLHKKLIELVDRERSHAEAGLPALIRLKANGLTEPKLIRALYKASQAGVKVELIIRGMCCLRPGVPGVSENIEVRSIIGRFLEHTRVYYFLNNGKDEVYAASADLMERNLLNRVETAFPIESNKLKERVKSELEAYMLDNSQAWILQSDGRYLRSEPAEGEEVIRAQNILLATLATTSS
ncbi:MULTISPECIES: polyphosphate kinase 1 [unclassified Oceanobacter]|jgi:polyphosphate kinase|uniref:polyphosphate kinase 1 n=1 Tax=unclassified Oceanobacter TaxID=2620260 RepID=UPI0026E47505|nr:MULTISPECIES: polyphosphate kinase 1 [unclassified Oceanobacter]MDO6680938.1 polyphosphate kinase 1 [Oceanobacter sp. 5_MG-2023]MDP2504699.1 polyphosphate kinase 1 [Oceanobacter sp. 3_MG-2023]MDP2546843.1 polyphosphate kinase 1 [Oceanobacter sp. 4_MG-2023]MDP2607670.1 polyphosphate kinase 1 [Oceanobacter sp. 1_MG-2023]MDP2611146.1 polyphosphate kinase 1 [Oceanobacter sp. 2_MG-2023]